MHADETGLNGLSGAVIGCAFTVLNRLGAGFLEKIYENALAHELRQRGLAVVQQRGIAVVYDGVIVGEHAVDLLVEQQVLVELKAVKTLDEAHFAQCMNYLKGTGLHLCLLLNFGNAKLQIKRIVNQVSYRRPDAVTSPS